MFELDAEGKAEVKNAVERMAKGGWAVKRYQQEGTEHETLLEIARGKGLHGLIVAWGSRIRFFEKKKKKKKKKKRRSSKIAIGRKEKKHKGNGHPYCHETETAKTLEHQGHTFCKTR